MVISEKLMITARDSMRELLNQAFEAKINFEPINVEPRVDHDGEDNIGIVVVFNGPENLLDAAKLNAVSVALGDALGKVGFYNIPVESYIAEDEYEEWLRLNSLAAPWLEEEDELAASV